MNTIDEVETLRAWKADAIEAMADNDRAYVSQAEMLKEMHGVIGKVADALHAAQLCLNGYIEIKDHHLPKIKRKREPK